MRAGSRPQALFSSKATPASFGLHGNAGHSASQHSWGGQRSAWAVPAGSSSGSSSRLRRAWDVVTNRAVERLVLVVSLLLLAYLLLKPATNCQLDRSSVASEDGAASASSNEKPKEQEQQQQQPEVAAAAGDPPDDPQPYPFEPRVTDWDQQRQAFLSSHPGSNMSSSGRPRVLMLSASDPNECSESAADHLLMRMMKNKVDYARQHGIEFFHSQARLATDFDLYWCKLPLVRSMMLSHPQVEWIFWVDSDAVFTDMSFELPLERYEGYNMAMSGDLQLTRKTKNWMNINDGIWLIRNCQWSLDFLAMMAAFAVPNQERDKWGTIFGQHIKNRGSWPADDQCSVVWLVALSPNQDKWAAGIFFEQSYLMHGYWDVIVDRFEDIALKSQQGKGDWSWPFTTHFVGCKLCHPEWSSHPREKCIRGIKRATDFADNQVLKSFGLVHKELGDSELVPLK